MIGEEARVRGFALAGALVFAVADAAAARAAWRSLPADVAVAVLTPRAAGWLRDVTGGGDEAAAQAEGLARRPDVLPVVMPPDAGPPETAPPQAVPPENAPPGTTPAHAPPGTTPAHAQPGTMPADARPGTTAP